MQPSTEDLIDALRLVDWGELTDLEPLRAFQLLHARSEALRDSEAAGFQALSALATAASMMLDGASWERPYSPFATWEGGGWPGPDQVSDDGLEFFKRALDVMPSSPLAARIADIVFIRASRGERFAAAGRAVDLYIGVGIGQLRKDEEGWIRAAEISSRFRMQDRVLELVRIGIEAFRSADPMTAWRVARAMRTARFFGDAHEEIADRLEELGTAESDPHVRRQILGESIRWRRGPDALDRASVAQAAIGDAWWTEAKQRVDSHMVTRDFFANAYNAYRACPRHLRSEKVQRRIERLPRIIRQHGDLARAEMQLFESDTIDLTPVRDQAEAAVDVPDFFEALARLIAISPLPRFEKDRASAEARLQAHPLMGMFSRSTVDSEGRKLHTTDPDRERSGVAENVWAEMISGFTHMIQLVVAGQVWPGVRKLSSMWRISLRDFEVLASASPFVPVELESLYGRALHHGYYGRIVEATFILAPTFEACVRQALQANGIETRSIRADDTEVEPGLSALMELPGVDDVLGVDLAWTIRALLCGPTGPNLRNRVAHGLVLDGEAGGDAATYLWWLALRLAFVPYFSALRQANGEAAPAKTTQ